MVIGEAVEFIKVIAGIRVVPLVGLTPAIPTGGVQFQVITTPAVPDVMVTGKLALLEQIVWSGIENCTVGAGLTVMVNVFGVPEQPRATGVTVIVATTAVVPLLIAVKAAIAPAPLATNPMEGVLFVQV